MDNKNTAEKPVKMSGGDQAVAKFTELMIARLKEVKASDWKQGWTNGKGCFLGMPQNIAGRNYSGTNSFFLQMDTAMNGYKMPVYMTFLQAMKENLRIKKGSEAMPVIYWDLNVKDANGHRMSMADYKQLTPAQQKKCEVRPFLRAFKVFNVDQTNLRDVNQEKYDALMSRFQGPQLRDKEGMYVNRALDRMFERQEWICRVQTSKLVDGAFYSPSRDLVVVPMKEQFNIGKNAEEIFKDGMEYYSSALHEMTHSTGTANRLNREKGSKFGDAKYAKEEMVAELTAAMVGNALGFDKRILNNNACYVDGWINAMRQKPKFIVSVMADVNKASKMILEKVDEQRIALGETPILSANMSKVDIQQVVAKKQHSKHDWKQPSDIALSVKFDDVAIFKQKAGNYAIRATFEGKDLGTKPVSKIDGVRYELMPAGAVKDQILQDTASRKFVDEINTLRKQGHQENKGLKL